MKQNYLPPLLRGIGMTIVLLATIFSIVTARDHQRANRIKQESLYAKAAADAAAQPAAQRNLAELKVEVEDLRSQMDEESVAEEVISNPWFEWMSSIGTAVIASSFYAESFLRKRGDN